jgi:peptidoglycan/xylan/chitin deacetylase (PgdA/CDA1 family)
VEAGDQVNARQGQALVAVAPNVDAPSVLLTYDDGPDPEGTPAVLRELAAADALATFFVLGTRVKLYPHVLRSVAAEGHEIALHGADHRRVDQIPEAEFSRVLIEAKDALEQALQRRVAWYRPPYGRLTASAWATVTDAGMAIAGWTCDVLDWQDLPHDQRLACLDTISRAGEIVLSHDAFADARDLVDDGQAPPVDRGALARAVLELTSSGDCSRRTLSEAMTCGSPVWQQWVGRA